MNQTLEFLNSICTLGEVLYDNGYFWQYVNNDEDRDFMFEVYCENSNILENIGCILGESWQDNNTCEFQIIDLPFFLKNE